MGYGAVLLSGILSFSPPDISPIPPLGTFRHIDLDHGLSDTHLRSIVQDREGFLWFGTLDGLNRYDGYEIRIFAHDPANPRSLASNYVQTLHVDRSGTLWVGTLGGGLHRYAPRTRDFDRFQHDPDDAESLASDEVFSICDEEGGVLWIATSKGLDRFLVSSRRFHHFQHDPDDSGSLADDNVYAVIRDRQGSIWVGTGRGLDRMERSAGQVRFGHYRHDPDDPQSLSHDYINALYEDEDETLWVGTWGGGLDKLDRGRRDFVRYGDLGFAGTFIWAIFGDRGGRVWVGAWNGGLQFRDRGSDSFRVYRHDSENPSSLSHDNVTSIYEDREGLVWVGTGGGGVSVLDPSRKPFSNVALGASGRAGPSSTDVRAIEEDENGVLWVGTYGAGLYSIDEEREITRQYRPEPGNPGSLTDDVVLAIEAGARGDLWIGTPNGLNRLDRATETFRRYQHDPRDAASLGDLAVVSILEDPDRGVVWIGTSQGLEHLDLRSESFVRHPNSDRKDDAHHVYAVRSDENGDLWLARSHGLDRFEPETGRFRHYSLGAEGSGSQTSVWAIHPVDGDRLWLGTSDGLLLFDSERGAATRFHEESQEPVGLVAAILEDDEGCLWLGRSRGLSRFEPETEEFRHYGSSETSRRLSFLGAALESRDGRFYFGAADGLTAFRPSSIEASTYVPPVVLTELEVDNRPMTIAAGSALSQSMGEIAQHRLHTRDRVVAFEFAALSYRAPERNRYRYRLEGFDADWTEVDSGRRRVTYTNLPAGSYLFRVKGSNNDGFWNDEGAALRLEVLPFWWQTSWFRWGSVIAAALALFGGHRLRIAVLREREERNRSVLESLKSRIALLDRRGRITAVNERWSAGALESGHGGGAIGDDYPEMLGRIAERGVKSAEEALAGVQSVLEGRQKLFDLEYPRISASGRDWYALSIAAFRGRGGGAVVSYTDITARKRAEEEARKQREELAHVARVATMGELTASIAHEINQPLASIVTYASAGSRFLDGGAPATEDVRGVLSAIAEQGKRAGDIVRHVRELLKKGRIEYSVLDVNELLRAMLTMVHGDAIAKGVAVRRSLAPGLPATTGNPVELQQVILNLVMNAFEAMEGDDAGPRQMTVRSWSDDPEGVQIAVTDTGPPVSDETLQKMFQRFYTSKPAGLGIGLSISQSIVEAHGGTLWAERNRDRGLTMRVSLKTSSSG